MTTQKQNPAVHGGSIKTHKRNNKRKRFHTLEEFLAIMRAFCPGATDDWLKEKFGRMSPIQCYVLWRKEQRLAAQQNDQSQARRVMPETHN